MRILLVASEFPPGPGGIGTHAHEIAQHLHRRGHEVRAIVSQDYVTDAEIAAFNTAQPFAITRVRRYPGAPAKLAYRCMVLSRTIAAWRPDVMLVSGDRESYAAAIAAGTLPWVCVEHGRRPRARWERAAKRWSFGRATTVVAVSEYSRQHLLALGVRPRASVVIPNGADPERFDLGSDASKRTLLTELGLDDAMIVLSVGHVSERKGQDILISALPMILRSVPKAHYVVVGKPTKVPEYRALAERLGVASHVHFLGQVEAARIPALFQACDLHVMTSRHTVDEFEGFGISVVEAALCGKPSVVSGDSGLREAVIEGTTGLVARLEDPEDTARAIAELLVDSGRRMRMGEAARHHAITEQTWARRVERYDHVLGQLAHRR